MDLIIQGGGFAYPYSWRRAEMAIEDHTMELHLQFGHGMMAHAVELVRRWGHGAVVLSPRDLTPEQLLRTSLAVRDAGGECMLDPQCFAHDQDHRRLQTHEYWQVFQSHATDAFLQGTGTADLLSSLARLDQSLGATQHILPGLMARPVSDDWFAWQESIISEAASHYKGGTMLATVALSSEAMAVEEQVEAVVEQARMWPVHGVYVVAETPSSYLVDNAAWLTNLLLLAAGLKLSGKHVVVGYCSHQMLCLASANVDAIASGTWLNVRAFQPSKFYAPDGDDTSRRTTWFYCPQGLSEYKLPFLDQARRNGVLELMRPDAALGSTFADPLFGSADPSTVNWGEQTAFRHYLTCLRSQVLSSRLASFDATTDQHLDLLDTASTLSRMLRSNGVYGQDRDFHERLDVNRSAVQSLAIAYGPRLRTSWEE